MSIWDHALIQLAWKRLQARDSSTLNYKLRADCFLLTLSVLRAVIGAFLLWGGTAILALRRRT